MKNMIRKFKNSVELEVFNKMTKPKIILTALALNVSVYVFMYAFLELILFIHYDL